MRGGRVGGVWKAASAALVLALLPAGRVLAQNAPALVATPFHASGIYNTDETAGWTISLAPGATPPAGPYTYTVKTNNQDVIKTGTLDLSSGSARLETSSAVPAMLYVQVNPPAAGRAGATTRAAGAGSGLGGAGRGRGGRAGGGGLTLGAAVAPTKLQLATPRPDDFDSFWDGKLAALGKIPMNPQLTPTSANKPGVDCYTVKLDSVDSHVQGYLARPTAEGKFPALIIYQWAGVYALQTSTVTDRAAKGWLCFDVDSHDLPPSQATGVSTNYPAIGNTDRETSYFLDMYLRDSRAVDYIASRPDWDGKTIVAMGTSMGGQQSLTTAGLNPKITAIIVNEPSGADSNGDLHGRKAGYPNWPSNDPKIMRTALYFDTVNFASRIKAPALVAMGFIDTTAPPVGIWTAFNQIPAAREAVPMIESEHNNITPNKQAAFNTRSEDVLNTLLKGGPFTPSAASTRP